MKILCAVGARPNFVKIAPILDALDRRRRLGNDVETLLVHTGQHYSSELSDVFFEELGIAAPDVNLGIGSGTHAQQTANIMLNFEPVLLDHRPDVLLLVGDVNSTLACALVAAKLSVPVAHVEAGLRSGDRSMPEETNRIVTDALSEILFPTCRDADATLLREGIPAGRISFVRNLMI